MACRPDDSSHNVTSQRPRLRNPFNPARNSQGTSQICATTKRKTIDLKIIQASQFVPCAPWRMPREAIQTEPVRWAIGAIKAKNRAHAHFDLDVDLRRGSIVFN